MLYRLLGFVFALLALSAGAPARAMTQEPKPKAQQRQQQKQQQQQVEAKRTQALIDARSFRFVAERISGATPTGSSSLAGGYCVDVMDGELECQLPFFGRSTSPVYGSNSNPFDFKSQQLEYKEQGDLSSKKGVQLSISAVPESTINTFLLTFAIYNNGAATLTVAQQNGDGGTYYGRIEELPQ